MGLENFVGFYGQCFFCDFCEFCGLCFLVDFVVFCWCVRFCRFWPTVLLHPGLHWLRHVLFFCEVGLIGPEARVLMIFVLLSLTLGALAFM